LNFRGFLQPLSTALGQTDRQTDRRTFGQNRLEQQHCLTTHAKSLKHC